MGINLFNKEKDEFEKQTKFEREAQNKNINASTSPEEQYRLEKTMPDPELTRWQQDLSPWLDEMEMKLKRIYRSGSSLYKHDMPPLCSDECIENLKTLLDPNTSPNLMMCKLDKDEIASKLNALENTVILDVLIPERKKYATPLAHLSQVKKIFRSFALPTFHRAFGGFEAINLRSVRTMKEFHTNDGIQDKKRGLLSW